MADLSPAGSGATTYPGRRLSEALLPLELAPRTQLQLSAISRWNALRGIRVGLVGAALLFLLIGANLATPVYPVLQQQLGAISDQVQNLTSATTNSIVDGLFQASQAEGLGISVPPEDVDAEIEALEARRAKTHDLKQAMMQELLTGRTRLVQPEAVDG